MPRTSRHAARRAIKRQHKSCGNAGLARIDMAYNAAWPKAKITCESWYHQLSSGENLAWRQLED